MPINLSKFKSSDEDARKFDHAPFDIKDARTKFTARLSRSLKQFNKELGKQGGVDFELGYHGQIKFKPTLNGNHVYIEAPGEAHFATSDKKFPDLIAALIAAVNAGEFDERIEAAATAPTNRTAASLKTKKVASTAPMTDEEAAAGVRKAFGIAIGKGATPADAAATITANQVELESKGKARKYTDAHIAAELAVREAAKA